MIVTANSACITRYQPNRASPAMAMRWVDYAIGNGILNGIGAGQSGKR